MNYTSFLRAITQLFAHLTQLFRDAVKDCAYLIDRACADTRQQFDSLFNRIDREDVEFTALDGMHHIEVEHQITLIRPRDQNTLAASQADCFTDLEKALDLLVGSSDRLHRAVLIDRSGNRQILPDGQTT